ncbi:hypothetical protein [Streptomyces barkulensis]|uniref:hypothetical protein n=1 Tax=Streptomyces barkulensis TaxID=1257026 RepID=UPI00117E00DD|nr:hypothetical protein [Streptomyces barkulensis]
MPQFRDQNPRFRERSDDPDRLIHAAGLGAGVVFALGFLAALVGAVFTGGFTVGGLLVTTSAWVSAGAGFMGWRRRQVAFSWGALGLLPATMVLSQAVTG